MERNSYGFYTKRSELLENLKKRKEQEKEQGQKQETEDETHLPKNQNVDASVTQHVSPAKLLLPAQGSGPSTPIKEDQPTAPNTAVTENCQKDKKDDDDKSNITITRTVFKESPGNQGDKAKTTRRPLQCLETLAEKAGITLQDKYEAANTLLALDKQNNYNRRPELKQPKTERDNQNQVDDFRFRNQKEEDDKLQIQQQIIQQQLQQQHLQQQVQHQFQQQLQQQVLQRQQQQAIQQRIKNQQEHQDLFNVPGVGEVSLSFLSSPQNNINLLFDSKNQTKIGMSNDIKPQQLVVDGQNPGQTVVQQMNMQHDQQHHQTVTVVSSMPNSMPPHQVQQQGGVQQQTGAGISTMPPIQSLPPNTQHPQQLSADWGHGRVQVIQQPLQNNSYLQQLYNTQGPLIMPGNIALHPGINSQQIQVIAAGKPFQGNQLAPHMLTAQGKQVLQGQAAPFPGYTTIPTIPTTQNQTFVFSPLSVINSQPSILPAHSQPSVSGMNQQQKSSELHKVMTGGKITGNKTVQTQNAQGQVPVQTQCVQVSQPVLAQQQPPTQIISPLQTGGQTMQFAPWQISGALPQVWTGGLQAGGLPAGGLLAPNPIFIRGAQPDAPPSMFIQHSPQNSIQHTTTAVACQSATVKPRASSDVLQKTTRPLSNILPSGVIRPASSVSTQTGASQPHQQPKQRGKPNRVRTPPAPATNKQDAANQTNKMQHVGPQPKQQLLVMNSTGQMTQISTVQDKQQVTNKLQQQQQQVLLQHQQQQHHHAIQHQQVQQQQQHQLIHPQHNTPQQMVQHYQQGMALSMQQASVNQSLPMTAMPSTISMVQHIHPLGGALVGQTAPTTSLAQLQTMQQQQPQTMVQGNLVQTSIGMAVQQQSLNHATSMQASALQASLEAPLLAASPLLQIPGALLSQEVGTNNISSPQLTLHASGTMSLITQPVQGSVLSVQSQQPIVTQIKTDEVKNQLTIMPPPSVPPVQHITPQQQLTPSETAPEPPASPVLTTASTPTPAVITTTDTTTTTTTSTGMRKPAPKSDTSVRKVVVSEAPTVSVAVSSSGPQTTSPPQVVTTVASSTCMVASTTSAITAPVSAVSAAVSLFKNTTVASPSRPNSLSQVSSQDKGLPKAMVKPNILTHVIEGYVIQEAQEPFAVNRPIREWSADKEHDKENKLPHTDEPPRKKALLEVGVSLSRITSSNESRSSTSNTPSGEPMPAQFHAIQGSSEDAAENLPNISKWTVNDVCEFIRAIPGCANYADDFLLQEVDGEALLLIKPQHLVMALSMKLGPALKIVASIDALRPDSERDPPAE